MVLWAHSPRLTKYSSSLLKVAASASALPCICICIHCNFSDSEMTLLAEGKFQLQQLRHAKTTCCNAESSMINNPALHPHLHVRRDYNTSLTLLCLVLVQRKKYDYEAMLS
mmetsp:Transcript_30282/g.47399  ORF Transcript_30282/g.47399 Transcript_30282/m.47399 type:complete len:111 (-) Transcript_30282:309-641(-)